MTMTWTWRSFANTALVVIALGMLLGQGEPALAAGWNCQSNRIPVALAPDLPRDKQVFARLCLPNGSPPATVQLLVHGATYTHLYWDFPDPTGGTRRYSYVNAALDAGFATLAMDRIGSGASSHPPGELVTIEANAYVVHQVVQALRAGKVWGPKGALGFQKVLLVGHSYGSLTSWYEVTDYQDVDAVILSGASHTPVPSGVENFERSLHPAEVDPILSGRGYDSAYLTTMPGMREAVFYLPSRADPAVIALDERTKSTITLAEFSALPAIIARPLDIRVPVLLVNGTEDMIFCGPTPSGICSDAQTLLAAEAPWLGPRVPCVEARVLPGEGHMLNLIPEAPRWFAVAQEWATRIVGTDPGPAPGCAR
ncbi:alpha/beta hydrolase [Cystobacter ferrugineus]|uniref:Alpha/beta hydrolase n=1 Tax=Cystobacter ferrugineus TaxID=83449 RepID=A0A1L9BG02_9BACT|nr:alpha/beta fold hydrolase [Cystobacter ferrugineus]OJH41204.1 alpha/beta hydrolase [Cystobacter ferrugineus]